VRDSHETHYSIQDTIHTDNEVLSLWQSPNVTLEAVRVLDWSNLTITKQDYLNEAVGDRHQT